MAGFEGTIEVSLPDLFSVIGTKTEVEEAVAVLAQASNVIETVSGVIFDEDYRERFLKKADALWVKRATVFQAAWMLEQPDSLSRTGVRSMTQDGMRVDATDDLTFVLAPLAKRALGNCSWAKSGTIKVGKDEEPEEGSILTSDNHKWSPIGSA